QYFLPAYKAGGPIQSIKNLAAFLSKKGKEVYIYCSDRDLDNSKLDVMLDSWTTFSDNIFVYYCSENNRGRKSLALLLANVKPDIIFINGLYSLQYTIYPLLYGGCKKILSVRGMLHPGALSQKRLKKRVYLNCIKMFRLHKLCSYHATTDEEVGYIINEFGANVAIQMIPNLPNELEYTLPPVKTIGDVGIVSIALISPMKNTLRVIQALKACKSKIRYSIYGPVKDRGYWEECLTEISDLPNNIHIEYKGEVRPEDVAGVLSKYHFFILPSKSENFGHAIYEAMSAGRPVITSHNTPWNGLNDQNAGYNIDPDNLSELSSVLDDIASSSDAEYKSSCESARRYVESKYNLSEVKTAYKSMFQLN
ncbi:MAG: glycosyltransferase, partial [Chitinophagaceae bacterium]|nr:glycosyltransferase [Chitinophagaceae bacterium]